MTDQITKWLPVGFPIFFAAMWILSTTVLGFMSGWFNLQQWYSDDGNEEPLLKLRGQSGRMGYGANLNRVLTLTAYRSGLGVRIWRIFGPFQRPIVIPWSEIDAEQSRSFFTPMVKLSFGKPPMGTLKINAQSWSKLVAAARPVAGPGLPSAPPISSGSVARGMFFEWLVLTGIAAAFFYSISRSARDGSGFSIGLSIGLPAVAIGIGQLVRFARLG